MSSDTSAIRQNPADQEQVEIRIEPNGKIFRVNMDLLLTKIPKLAGSLTDADSITISAGDEKTVAVLFHWLEHGTLPQLEASDDLFDSWSWNPLGVYNLAIKLDLDEIQDRVMVRLVRAIHRKQMERKSDWLKSHWNENDGPNPYTQDEKQLDPDLALNSIDSDYQPNFPSVAMVHAIYTQAPEDTPMKVFGYLLMAHIIIEGGETRSGDWETANVFSFLAKDMALLRDTITALRNSDWYYEWRDPEERRGFTNPTDINSSWGQHISCLYHKHKRTGTCPYRD